MNQQVCLVSECGRVPLFVLLVRVWCARGPVASASATQRISKSSSSRSCVFCLQHLGSIHFVGRLHAQECGFFTLWPSKKPGIINAQGCALKHRENELRVELRAGLSLQAGVVWKMDLGLFFGASPIDIMEIWFLT